MAAVALVGRAGAQVWEVGNILLTQSPPSDNAAFGLTVAVGDFDGDGNLDLAVGAPLWSNDTGSVTVFRGGGPLRTLEFLAALQGDAASDHFGEVLAAGDFDHDGQDELAIGAPYGAIEYGGGPVTSGYVRIAKWSAACPCFETQTISQADTTAFAVPGAGNLFGAALAAGDLNGDRYADLAVGANGVAAGGHTNAGAVQIFYGGASGLRTDNAQGFEAGTGGVLGTPGNGDVMGAALAIGDFDGDGKNDLAISAPHRTVGSATKAGEVHVLRGSSSGLVTTGQQLLSQESFGGTSGTNDGFGTSLAAQDFLHDQRSCGPTLCYADLAIGAPGKTVSGQTKAGEVVVGYGGPSGISTSGATVLTQNGNGDTPEANDQFGLSLSAGGLQAHFGGLAVGVPTESFLPGLQDDGLVQLFFGAPGGLDSGLAAQLVPQAAGFHIAPAADFDAWGYKVLIADLDGDGWGDAIIAANKTVSGHSGAGAVEVLFGAMFADGFESGGTAMWSGISP